MSSFTSSTTGMKLKTNEDLEHLKESERTRTQQEEMERID